MSECIFILRFDALQYTLFISPNIVVSGLRAQPLIWRCRPADDVGFTARLAGDLPMRGSAGHAGIFSAMAISGKLCERKKKYLVDLQVPWFRARRELSQLKTLLARDSKGYSRVEVES